MKVVLFGATGMIGQGVLRESLLDPGVEAVLAIGRNRTGRTEPKLHEITLADLRDYSGVERELAGYDACFFCVGVSSAGMSEADYRRVTYDIAVAAGRILARLNPQMTFVFVSGAGADSTGRGRVMWARVKGETENAILAMPFKASYVVRPAFILPRHGIRSRTAAYRLFYAALGPLYPVWKALFPRYVTTTEQIGRAMLALARHGAPKRVLETPDLVALTTP
jgi:uncharacterized protein YbjT (DUF2867 family)